MRLGAQPTRLEPGTLAARCYGKTEISERHRHRYEFNNVYRQQFAAHGMKISGTSPDGSLVEVVELPEHPWFLAVQYHPEFKSKPTSPQPLFAGFVGAAVAHSHGKAAARSPPPRRRSGPVAATPTAPRCRHDVRLMPLDITRNHGRRKEDHHRRRLEVAGAGREGGGRQRPAPHQRPKRRQARSPKQPATCRCRPRRSRCWSRRSPPKR